MWKCGFGYSGLGRRPVTNCFQRDNDQTEAERLLASQVQCCTEKIYWSTEKKRIQSPPPSSPRSYTDGFVSEKSIFILHIINALCIMCMWSYNLDLSAQLISTHVTCSDMQLVAFILPPYKRTSKNARWTKVQTILRPMDTQFLQKQREQLFMPNAVNSLFNGFKI
jgi:hypothetical protein